MKNFFTTSPLPPPPPPPPPFRFRLIEHLAKEAYEENKLNSCREKLQNQESQPVNQEPNLHNHEQTPCGPGTIDLFKGSGTTRRDWVISIRDKLERANRQEDYRISDKREEANRQHDRTSLSKLCIYKVPHDLHRAGKKSYLPQVVTLGPYHYRQELTQSMESHKRRAVYQVLKRTRHGIEVFIDAMIELEEEARACYESNDLKSNEFTEMLLLDGCFVLEVLRGVAQGFSALGYERNDPVFGISGSMRSIQRDMIMIENQLPLFVLNRLLELELGTPNHTGVLVQLVVRFFDTLIPRGEMLAKGISIDPSVDDLDKKHCLDVFRRSLLLPDLEPELSGKRWDWRSSEQDKFLQQMLPSATELKATGFQFCIRKTDRFWDIKFNNGYLEIPTLVIHDGTKSLFLNIIAFEQCHIDSSNNITSYILFMKNLINSVEDVSYLRECGIVEHALESHSEVVDMFDQLCQGVVIDTNDIYLSQLLTEVYHHYHENYINKWNLVIEMNKHLATLKERYFDTPWAYLPFFAAVILLGLTISQTYFAAYAYFH